MNLKRRVLIGSAHDRQGGAAVAAARLRDGLLALQQDVRMFVQTQDMPHPTTHGPQGGWQRTLARARSGLDALPLRRHPGHGPFSVNWLPRFSPRWPHDWPSDVVHLHWVHAGYMSLGDMQRLRQPVIWTLHDMWAVTGGCHYDEECGRWRHGCGTCPVLGSRQMNDLSARRWQARRRAYAGMNLTIVSPSRWLAECARSSPLLASTRVVTIRNGLDLMRFKPLDRRFARLAVGLPVDRPAVLFGALNAGSDQRKGYDLLQAALGHLQQGRNDAETQPSLVVFGSSPPRRETQFGMDTWHVGHLHDDLSLALLYAACDVFVAPSRQENLPNTVAEALACGTPCVAFDIGGMPDLIEHRVHGYLARAFDAADLAQGIRWALDLRADDRAAASAAARRFAEVHLDVVEQARAHLNLYEEILANTGSEAS